MRVLVTGGAGYIGLHASLELLGAGHEVVILDNLVNSKREALGRLETLAGQSVSFYEGDVRDRALLDRVFTDHKVDAVMHFAGLKAVGESTQRPLEYYDVNVNGSWTLVSAMVHHQVHCIVFSSSATVYGNPHEVPIREDFPLSATNPYGRTKLVVEEMLRDVAAAYPELSVVLLRYFNPGGAHKSGLIGEDPNGIPNNLIPFIAQVAVGKRDQLAVFGDDYDTPDGTGVRDYIHVLDLAEGHVVALERLHHERGVHVYNLGTGRGYSVLQVLKAFEAVVGRPLKYRVVDRRPGDIGECWADPAKATESLGWSAKRGIGEMVEDVWRWQSQNPDGFSGLSD
ncbi:UDP-glucose 4-epimerase GalE [Marinimicrobium sp. ARAG 43.8]|uniref:UDP-glucose 4-epimerase GalE n=1 Tax=Marinimicrobium sp. ARAG 43.8 TaxID=3418719 RepID=UPI003CF23E7B